jgi:hypothetical protein
MEFSDVVTLAGLYAGYVVGVFGAVYGPVALWRYFKDLANPQFRDD